MTQNYQIWHSDLSVGREGLQMIDIFQRKEMECHRANELWDTQGLLLWDCSPMVEGTFALMTALLVVKSLSVILSALHSAFQS